MIEVAIDSIRISLITQHRLVMLKEIDGDRHLTIWIGPCEAESITMQLQDVEIARPGTHDLLRTVVEKMGAKVSHIVVSELKDMVFYALLVLDINGELMEIDCRPSDAIALAVRVKVPIFVTEQVMNEAGAKPEEDIRESLASKRDAGAEAGEGEDAPDAPDAFADFLGSLDFDDL